MRINPRLLVCITLLLFAVTATSAQVIVPNTPTSGAMLTINGTVNGIPVNILIYDSQIHSGAPQPVPQLGGTPPCTAADAAVVTDAYVLQGGSATGCDPTDAYEVTDGNGSSPRQSPGKRNIALSAGPGSAALPGTGFNIETHYCINGSSCFAAGVATVNGQYCNTLNTICANPDTGFLTVTNSTGYPFTGTIKLQGKSALTVPGFCPTGGVAFDAWSQGLTNMQSVALALGSGTNVTITAANSTGDTQYNYVLNYGPDLQVGETIVISGLSDTSNPNVATQDNGTFTIATVTPASGAIPAMFTVAPSGATASNPQNGTGLVAVNADTSNCGGFNFDQVSPPQLGTIPPAPVTFLFGEDKFTVTPSSINAGDILTFRPVPVPNGQFDLPGLSLPANAAYGANTQCAAIRDFSSPSPIGSVAPLSPNPVCPEFQTHCYKDAALTTDCGDIETFVWTGEFDAHLDPNAGYPTVGGTTEVGGVHFLGAPGVPCLQKSFSEDIVTSYAGDTVGDLPLKSGGSGLNCFVTTFDPSATPIAPGVVVTPFTGFSAPVNDAALNLINPGRTVPLKFSVTNGAGGLPLTTLTYCNNPAAGCTAPWITLFMTAPAACANGIVADNTATDTTLDTNSGFQNLGNGNYQFNWVTSKATDPIGYCTTINVELNGAIIQQVANFKFSK